jgi:hypothetical protein
MSYNFIEAAGAITASERHSAVHAVNELVHELRIVEVDLACNAMPPLVCGDEEQAHPSEALHRIVAGRTKSEGKGPVSSLEAWMQAGIITTAVVAAQEVKMPFKVSDEKIADLRDSFTSFALRNH